MNVLLCTSLALACATAPAVAFAADPNGTPARAVELDLSIPEAPGFAVIDLKPSSVVDPAAQRVTAVQALGYVDQAGNLKPGFALSVSPYFWVFRSVTLDHYQTTSLVERVLGRLQASAGFAEGGEGARDRYGLGFTTELLDAGDYRMDEALYRCFRGAHDGFYGKIQESRGYDLNEADRQARRDLGLVGVTTTAEQEADIATRVDEMTRAKDAQARRKIRESAGPQFDAALEACRAERQTRISKKPSWTVAGGWAFRSKGGGLGNEASDGGSFWTALRLPLPGEPGEALAPEELNLLPQSVTAFARYDVDRKPDDAAASQTYDKFTAALVGNYQWKGRLQVGLQAGYEDIDYGGPGPLNDASSAFYAAKATYRMRQGVWLELEAGQRRSNPAAPGDKDAKVSVNLRFSPTQR